MLLIDMRQGADTVHAAAGSARRRSIPSHYRVRRFRLNAFERPACQLSCTSSPIPTRPTGSAHVCVQRWGEVQIIRTGIPPPEAAMTAGFEVCVQTWDN